MAYLAISDLSFTYRGSASPALDRVTLSVEEGEFVLLLGRSGCGKTTLLRCLKPALAPYGETTGTVEFRGASTDALSERDAAALIGFVGQDPERQTVCDTVFAEIAFGLESIGVDPTEIAGRVAEAADFLGIGRLASRKISELSGGEKQLVNLASALALRPHLLLLDEPVSRLDPPAKLRFLSAVRRVNQETGVTVILAGHDTEELFSQVDRVVLMEKGRIVSTSTPSDLARDAGGSATPFLPTVCLVWRAAGCAGAAPLSVREGRAFLQSIAGELLPSDFEPQDGKCERKKASDGAPPLLSAVDLWFRYGRNEPDVVQNLSFSVRPGEIVSILGPNGAGKTTLFKLLAGILRPVAGAVRFDGKKGAPRTGRDGIAYLPQDPKLLFAHDTVREELAEMTAGSQNGVAGTETVVSRLELGRLLDAHPYDISGGEQTRLAIAKLLLLSPRVLLLDEPTAGLDPVARDELRSILAERAKAGCAILIATHDLEFAAGASDRAAMFFCGRLTSCADVRRFFFGNRFYTTQAARLTRDLIPTCLTADEAVSAVLKRKEEVS